MAIKDLKKRLETDEANSGEALAKKLEKALNAVYEKGWSSFVGTQNAGLSVKGADSLWEESYKEILSEGKRAVKATKKDKATEIRNDMVSLVSDIAATSGVNAPIAAGIQEMLDAVLPIVTEKIDALKKSDTVFKSMKKNAIKSAASAVEGFASGILAPLPFGMGDAMLGKAKGLLGGNTERREEKAMAFASRLEDGGGSGGGSGKESGGIVSSASGGSSDSGEADGGKVVEILTEMEEHLQHIRDNTESAESRRERLRKKGLKGTGGKIAGAGAEMAEDGGGFGILEMLGLSKIGGGLLSFLGGKGGLFSNIFRNIKAALLRIVRKVFGKGGGAVLSKLLTGLGFVGRLAGIAGVIIAPLIDGITGWFKADEWNTTKGKAVIGAAIGGTGSGASGAFWGALKGGALGFATGGPLGALAGVLIGAITGWFGGERIAKALTDIENFFNSKWESMMISLGLNKETTATNRKKQTKLESDIAATTALPDGTAGKEVMLTELEKKLAVKKEEGVNAEQGKGFRTNVEIENEKKKIQQSLTSMRSRLAIGIKEKYFQGKNGLANKKGLEDSISIDEANLQQLIGSKKTGGPINETGAYELHSGEMVMDNQAAGIMMSAVSIAGQTMNKNAMARVGYGGMGGVGSAPTVIDSSSQTIINNSAVYIPPQPSGQTLPGSGRDRMYG